MPYVNIFTPIKWGDLGTAAAGAERGRALHEAGQKEGVRQQSGHLLRLGYPEEALKYENVERERVATDAARAASARAASSFGEDARKAIEQRISNFALMFPNGEGWLEQGLPALKARGYDVTGLDDPNVGWKMAVGPAATKVFDATNKMQEIQARGAAGYGGRGGFKAQRAAALEAEFRAAYPDIEAPASLFLTMAEGGRDFERGPDGRPKLDEQSKLPIFIQVDPNAIESRAQALMREYGPRGLTQSGAYLIARAGEGAVPVVDESGQLVMGPEGLPLLDYRPGSPGAARLPGQAEKLAVARARGTAAGKAQTSGGIAVRSLTSTLDDLETLLGSPNADMAVGRFGEQSEMFQAARGLLGGEYREAYTLFQAMTPLYQGLNAQMTRLQSQGQGAITDFERRMFEQLVAGIRKSTDAQTARVALQSVRAFVDNLARGYSGDGRRRLTDEQTQRVRNILAGRDPDAQAERQTGGGVRVRRYIGNGQFADDTDN